MADDREAEDDEGEGMSGSDKVRIVGSLKRRARHLLGILAFLESH